jgi:hypothetical protein
MLVKKKYTYMIIQRKRTTTNYNLHFDVDYFSLFLSYKYIKSHLRSRLLIDIMCCFATAKHSHLSKVLHIYTAAEPTFHKGHS